MTVGQILLNFRIDPELKERLEQQAEKEHRTLSGLIKHVMLTYLEELANKEKKQKR